MARGRLTDLHPVRRRFPPQSASTQRPGLASALSAAERLLRYRPRSGAELRQRLGRRGFPPQVIETALAQLRDRGLVDDLAFAQYWTEQRSLSRPRSRRLVVWELRAKGVEETAVETAVADLDDEAAAERAARQRASALRGLDEETFQRRLASYLLRRGFGAALAREVARRQWLEEAGMGEEA